MSYDYTIMKCTKCGENNAEFLFPHGTEPKHCIECMKKEINENKEVQESAETIALITGITAMTGTLAGLAKAISDKTKQ